MTARHRSDYDATRFREVFEGSFTYANGFARNTHRFAGRPALREPDTGRSWTYAELGDAVDRIAGWLVRHGGGRGFGRDGRAVQLPRVRDALPGLPPHRRGVLADELPARPGRGRVHHRGLRTRRAGARRRAARVAIAAALGVVAAPAGPRRRPGRADDHDQASPSCSPSEPRLRRGTRGDRVRAAPTTRPPGSTPRAPPVGRSPSRCRAWSRCSARTTWSCTSRSARSTRRSTCRRCSTAAACTRAARTRCSTSAPNSRRCGTSTPTGCSTWSSPNA